MSQSPDDTLMRAEQIDHLHRLRSAELDCALQYFPRPDGTNAIKVLEIGAGTGRQAQMLSGLGYDVIAIDVAGSAYRGERVFDVLDYDGHHIPAEDGKFDVIFSSNVLEHVEDLDGLLREMRRVAAPEGIGIHLMPSPSWRVWTSLAHYIWLLKKLSGLPTRAAASLARQSEANVSTRPRHPIFDLVPARHGERGNMFTEPYYFSARWWRRKLESMDYSVKEVAPTNIFYTGSVLFGQNLPIKTRQFLSSLLGSSCHIYVVHSCPPAVRHNGSDSIAGGEVFRDAIDASKPPRYRSFASCQNIMPPKCFLVA